MGGGQLVSLMVRPCHYQDIDVGLLHKGVEDVQNAVYIPDVRVVTKDLYLFRCPTLQFATELHKRLELFTCAYVNCYTHVVRSHTDLVQKLVDDVPQPLVGQLNIQRSLCIWE